MAAKKSGGKRIRYPNGFEGTCSDKVAEILGKRPGHKILGNVKAKSDEPEVEAEPDEKKD